MNATDIFSIVGYIDLQFTYFNKANSLIAVGVFLGSFSSKNSRYRKTNFPFSGLSLIVAIINYSFVL